MHFLIFFFVVFKTRVVFDYPPDSSYIHYEITPKVRAKISYIGSKGVFTRILMHTKSESHLPHIKGLQLDSHQLGRTQNRSYSLNYFGLLINFYYHLILP